MRKARLAALAGLAAIAFGQMPAEPEFEDVFYGIGHQGELVALERQEVVNHVKLGVMKANGSIQFRGTRSPVRFQSGQLSFVVRSSSKGDPAAAYHVRKMQSKKNSREAVLVHASPFGVSTKSSAAGLVEAEFSRYGESSLKVTVSLEPGEYAIGRARGQTVFCFGVD